MTWVRDRDGQACVACGRRDGAFSEHHRIKGNRDDNRASNLILLCGTGTTGCHGVRVHGASHRTDPRRGRYWAGRLGYLLSRHGMRTVTLTALVWYHQPSLGRVGWYRLDDEGGIHGPVNHPEPGREDLP